jgi:16S rRNA (guanine527-N7)-methyltransferase
MGIDFNNYQILSKFNVSRETYYILDNFRKIVIKKNRLINLISQKTEENFIERHIIDCAQAIDFIDINGKTCTDIGSGAGLPGIVLAIVLKKKNIKMKMNLYEKSHHKSKFLKQISEKLKLDVEVFQKDIFKEKNLVSGSIIARAFKPLPIILDLVQEKFKNYKNLVVFMGKNGKQMLEDSVKKWKFEYKEKRSLTSKDSFLINIKNIKKNEQD